ncbi:hypothetical protein TRFO_01611 [Tritrichomonas foetus]|uniref:Right handed beta helix domain-containing protein n=1 Tax=Tritrichomonas foetus TaxID=1144522 RepID=A0A1J4JRJ5_9EUKA|nr:hypothetical protein TRFO_01611 [Tritrichomonas foetus]|eukprot:OHT01056.1 hypothetical protein TRFO_01611 [Tritrichomonas foetus]
MLSTNTSILKLMMTLMITNSPLISQSMIFKRNQFSLQNSRFSKISSPILHSHQFSTNHITSCLFSHIIATSKSPISQGIDNEDLFLNWRIRFQFDGRIRDARYTTLNSCIFQYCFSYSTAGCIDIFNGRVDITRNTFYHNNGKYGGAIRVTNVYKLAFNQNSFDLNTADHFGAAYLDTNQKDQISSKQNNFTRNSGNVWVGALELDRTTGLLQDFIFQNNRADQCAAYYDFTSPPHSNNLINFLFLNNSARKRGGAITNFHWGQIAEYFNCVFIGNRCNEGNCIYMETRKIQVTLKLCAFDCTEKEAIYQKWGGSEALNDNSMFETPKSIMSEKYQKLIEAIEPVPKLEWFL